MDTRHCEEVLGEGFFKNPLWGLGYIGKRGEIKKKWAENGALKKCPFFFNEKNGPAQKKKGA